MERNTKPSDPVITRDDHATAREDRVTPRLSLDDLVGRVDRRPAEGVGRPGREAATRLAHLDPAKLLAGLAVVALLLGLGWWLSGRGSGAAAIDLPMTSVATGDPAKGGAAGAGTASSEEPTEATTTAGETAQPNGASSTDGPPTSLVVHVAGSVVTPGLVGLPAGARVADAIAAAGGLAPTADADRLNLAESLVDGQRVFVPVVGQEPPPQVPLSGGTVSAGGSPGAAGPVPRVSLNSATAEELDALPGVGPSTAAAIVAYRDQNGPFTSIDDLLDVRGIGPAKLEGLVDLVQVG